MKYYVLLKSVTSGSQSEGIYINSIYQVFNYETSTTDLTQSTLTKRNNVPIQSKTYGSWSAFGGDLLLLANENIKSPENVELFKTLSFSLNHLQYPQTELSGYIIQKVMENRLHNFQNPDNQLKIDEEEIFNYCKEKIGTEQKGLVDYKSIIINYFGEENVEFYDNDKEFIVFFPKSQLQNSSGRTHTIYNTYLKCTVRKRSSNIIFNDRLSDLSSSFVDKINLLPMETTKLYLSAGTRTLVSRNEHDSNYFFSHMNRARHNWVGCCLGDGILNRYANTINIETEEQVFGFCLALENYLKWESIEGGPYIRMSDIIASTPRAESFNINNFVNDILASLGNTENLISNINNDLSIVINQNILDEVNSYYGLKQGYSVNFLPKIKLLNSVKDKTSTTSSLKTYGDDFFKFKGNYVGKVYIDESLNKNSKEQILSGELVKFQLYYANVIMVIQEKIKKIINDNPSKYLEKKSTFNIS